MGEKRETRDLIIIRAQPAAGGPAMIRRTYNARDNRYPLFSPLPLSFVRFHPRLAPRNTPNSGLANAVLRLPGKRRKKISSCPRFPRDRNPAVSWKRSKRSFESLVANNNVISVDVDSCDRLRNQTLRRNHEYPISRRVYR